MIIIDFVLGLFIGVVIVTALVVVAVIFQPSESQRARLVQAEAESVQTNKHFSSWKNNPVVRIIMRAWSKGSDHQELQRDESATPDLSPAQAPILSFQEANTEDMPQPEDDKHFDDFINNLKPDDDVVEPAPEVENNTAESGMTPTAQVDEAVSWNEDNENDNKRSLEMVDIPHNGDGPGKYSPHEDESNPQKKGNWASAFTDIQAEESKAGKLAKTLDNVDIYDLLVRCQSLTKLNRNQNT